MIFIKLKSCATHLNNYRQWFMNVFFFLILDERINRVLLFSSKRKKKKTFMNTCYKFVSGFASYLHTSNVMRVLTTIILTRKSECICVILFSTVSNSEGADVQLVKLGYS